jgi:DNA-binding response OmpR family regulator
VRSLPKLRDTAVIGISAEKSQEKIDSLLDAGADDFVPKPFDVETLVERIVNLIGPVIIGTSGRATTGKISGKLTKQVTQKTDAELDDDITDQDNRMTRKTKPANPHRTTHGGVLAGPEEEEDFGT